jgi:hypothetical protein
MHRWAGIRSAHALHPAELAQSNSADWTVIINILKHRWVDAQPIQALHVGGLANKTVVVWEIY